MHGRGTSHGWLVHLMAGIALGAAGVLVAWIVAGGQPFGRVIGGDDVSAPTSTVVAKTAVERRAASSVTRGARLTARPPELVSAPELEFMEPKRKRTAAKASEPAARPQRKAKARRPARKAKARRPGSPVVRVVTPPETDAVAVAPVPTATPVPAPPPAAAPPAPRGAGGGSASPRPAGGGTMEG